MLVHSPKELAQLVHSQRKKQQLSQAKASDIVGLKQTTLSKFETHPDHTRLSTLFRILSALGLEIQITPKSHSRVTQEWKEPW